MIANKIIMKIIEAMVITLRHPYFLANVPDNGMERKEPIPIQRRSMPIMSSETDNPCLTIGTKGAHVAQPKPEKKNIALTAYCCHFKGISFINNTSYTQRTHSLTMD